LLLLFVILSTIICFQGKGRAFCAGGDVAAVVRDINNDSWKYGADFFRNEFLLNYIIATYSKPQVSLLAGIVMGGGAGVSLHGRFRVATENTVYTISQIQMIFLFPSLVISSKMGCTVHKKFAYHDAA